MIRVGASHIGFWSESEQKTIRRGALHRARERVYSVIKRGYMRQRIGQVAGSAGLSGGYLLLKCAAGIENHKEAKTAV